MPSWDAVLMDEEPHDRNMCNWDFTQDGRVSEDIESRVIKHGIGNRKAHAQHQTKNSSKIV